MPELILILEDAAQEALLIPLVNRMAAGEGVSPRIRIRSASRGFARVVGQLSSLEKDCRDGLESMPDAVVAVVDANCKGFNERRKALVEKAGVLSDRLVPAIPDPHIERWFLLDSHAFKKVLGRGCKAPDDKCEKDRYKRLLDAAVRESGVEPVLGGIEIARDLCAEMDLQRVAERDHSFAQFRDALRARLKLIRKQH